MIAGLTKLGVAFVGFKATNHWTGALSALIALRMAEGGNLAGGVAGVGVLGLLGLSQLPAPVESNDSDLAYLALAKIDALNVPLKPGIYSAIE